ncbi:MAG: bifunctional folylpolyglutamate synthase/dihydrofolate synthase [Acidimicrobiales bacterium]
MDLSAALAYLDEHVNLEAMAVAGRAQPPSLDRTRELVGLMADPQHQYPVVHLTGTNGKTSTARMTAALCAAQGLSVGTYTSPHLDRVNDRMAWNGDPIDDGSLAGVVAAVAGLEPLLGGRPSYFEILTAAAFRWFADVAVDVAVVEVGLLGRWDATNVADGQVAVVTNVGADHLDYAGSREGVAREKAGIVKPGSILVLGEPDPALAPVFEAAGAAAVWRRGDDFACDANHLAHGGRLLRLRTPGAIYDEVFLPLHGAHQGDKAACALAAAEAFFGTPLAEEVVAEALGVVRSPGRLQVVSRQPLCLLDGAHNPDGAEALARALLDDFAGSAGLILVVGMLRPHDPAEMLGALDAGRARLVVACPPPSPRAVPPAEIAAAAAAMGVAAETAPSVAEALDLALAEARPDEAVVGTGSLYTVGAARAARWPAS